MDPSERQPSYDSQWASLIATRDALKSARDDAELMARFCQLAHNLTRPVASELEQMGYSVARSFPDLNARPLFFVHIPKTAGASVHQFLDSQFDEQNIFPGWNPADLEYQKTGAGSFLLYRGHFTAGQRVFAPHNAELFTILRKPADQVYSFYAWLKHLTPSYWRQADKTARDRGSSMKTIAGRRSRRLAEAAMRTAKTLSFSEYLKLDDYLSRAFIDDLATRHMSDLGDANSEANFLHERMLSHDDRSARYKLAASARRNLKQCPVAGVYERLDISLRLLCWHRGWAAPEQLTKIHVNGSRAVFRPTNAVTRRLTHQRTKNDRTLYYATRSRLERQWAALLLSTEGHRDVDAWLDTNHRLQFFATGQTVQAVDVDADKAWPGRGWGLRERNVHGQVWRWFGSQGKASFLMRLPSSTDYLLTILVHTASSARVLDSLQVHISGRLQFFAGRGDTGGYPAIHWLIGRETVEQSGGNIEVALSIATEGMPNSLAVSRIVCHPW